MHSALVKVLVAWANTILTYSSFFQSICHSSPDWLNIKSLGKNLHLAANWLKHKILRLFGGSKSTRCAILSRRGQEEEGAEIKTIFYNCLGQ